MSKPNIISSNQTHRIFISSSKIVGDHIGLYMISFLFILLFILIFYLFYNFISYKRYYSSRKINSKNFQLNNHLSNEYNMKRCMHSYQELIISSHQTPLQTNTSLSFDENLKEINKSISNNQYQIKNRLISDL